MTAESTGDEEGEEGAKISATVVGGGGVDTGVATIGDGDGAVTGAAMGPLVAVSVGEFTSAGGAVGWITGGIGGAGF